MPGVNRTADSVSNGAIVGTLCDVLCAGGVRGRGRYTEMLMGTGNGADY